MSTVPPHARIRTWLDVAAIALPIVAMAAGAGGLRLLLLGLMIAGVPIREDAVPYRIDLAVAAALSLGGLVLSVWRRRSTGRGGAAVVLSLVSVFLLALFAGLAFSFDGGAV